MAEADVKVVMLSGKDAAIMKGLQTLRMMEEKIEPLMQVRDLMQIALCAMVFNGTEDAEYVIKLDDDHTAILRQKDGELDYEMTCACDGKHDAANIDHA